MSDILKCPAEIRKALYDLLLAHRAFFIDWAKWNHLSPDYDPDYNPEFPEIVLKTEELLRRIEIPAAEDPEVVARERKIGELAMATLTRSDGTLEFDPNPPVSEGDDNGAYVQAWAWVDFAGTEFDKAKKEVD